MKIIIIASFLITLVFGTNVYAFFEEKNFSLNAEEIRAVNVPMIINQSQSGELIFDAEGIAASLKIEKGDIRRTAIFNFNFSELDLGRVPDNSGASLVGGGVYNFSVNDDSGIISEGKDVQISLYIQNAPNDLNLGVYSYNSGKNRWEAVTGFEHDPVQHKFIFDAEELGSYAVFMTDGIPKYLKTSGKKQDQPPSSRFSEGTLLRTPEKKIYVVENNAPRHIKTLDEYLHNYHGKKFLEVDMNFNISTSTII